MLLFVYKPQKVVMNIIISGVWICKGSDFLEFGLVRVQFSVLSRVTLWSGATKDQRKFCGFSTF